MHFTLTTLLANLYSNNNIKKTFSANHQAVIGPTLTKYMLMTQVKDFLISVKVYLLLTQSYCVTAMPCLSLVYIFI